MNNFTYFPTRRNIFIFQEIQNRKVRVAVATDSNSALCNKQGGYLPYLLLSIIEKRLIVSAKHL